MTADLRVVLAEMRELHLAHGEFMALRTLDAVEAVLGLHRPDGHGPNLCDDADCWTGCDSCNNDYPCPTVRAITDALGGA